MLLRGGPKFRPRDTAESRNQVALKGAVLTIRAQPGHVRQSHSALDPAPQRDSSLDVSGRPTRPRPSRCPIPRLAGSAGASRATREAPRPERGNRAARQLAIVLSSAATLTARQYVGHIFFSELPWRTVRCRSRYLMISSAAHCWRPQTRGYPRTLFRFRSFGPASRLMKRVSSPPHCNFAPLFAGCPVGPSFFRFLPIATDPEINLPRNRHSPPLQILRRE